MTWSADDEYRTRVLARRGAVLQLRHPGLAFGPAAAFLMFATGLMAAAWGASLAGMDGAQTVALNVPVGVATVIAMLAIGGRLQRHEVSGVGGIVMRAALIWALFGAVWVLGAEGPMIVGAAGEGFAAIAAQLSEAGAASLGGALIGAFGGLAGGAAATLLCVERRA